MTTIRQTKIGFRFAFVALVDHGFDATHTSHQQHRPASLKANPTPERTAAPPRRNNANVPRVPTTQLHTRAQTTYKTPTNGTELHPHCIPPWRMSISKYYCTPINIYVLFHAMVSLVVILKNHWSSSKHMGKEQINIKDVSGQSKIWIFVWRSLGRKRSECIDLCRRV